MNRIASLLAVLAGLLFAVPSWAHHTKLNQFAEQYCTAEISLLPCRRVQAGDTWDNLFPDPTDRLRVQKYNRQNATALMAGQWLVVPYQSVPWRDLSPLPVQVDSYVAQPLVLRFDPAVLAWGEYRHGTLVHWGPAVGGRPGYRTEIGWREATHRYGANKLSTVWPKRKVSGGWLHCSVGNPTLRGCAPMPYFVRLNLNGDWSGEGFHERAMNGAHASGGCIGVFGDDARYINQQLFYEGLPVHILPYEERI